MNWRTPLLLLAFLPSLFADEFLPGTKPLESVVSPEDRSTEMIAGIARWLNRESERMTADRHQRWEAAAHGPDWEKFAAAKREELAATLGFEKQRAKPAFEQIAGGRVRWTVFDGVQGEGILIQPPGPPRATVIVVPDANELPEKCLLATLIARWGCQVLVPVLVSREDEFSGNSALRWTSQPHREWIYRQAFEVGRTPTGYEVQKVLAALDGLQFPSQLEDRGFGPQAVPVSPPNTPVFLAGRGEGGLIALRAAALDPRFQGVLVRGSFEPHAAYFREPIDRNVFGFRTDFGEAELAALIAPRRVTVNIIPENNLPPEVSVVSAREGRTGAAPGTLTPPSGEMVRSEVEVANRICGANGQVTIGDGAEMFPPANATIPPLTKPPRLVISNEEALERQRRTVRELEQHTQHVVIEAERARNEQVWAKVGTPEWPTARAALQERLWASIGKLPGERLPPNPRTRRVMETDKWTAYEVMLDVVPDVFAWGWLLVPKDLQPGEHRAVVVCQHGLEGLPGDGVTLDEKTKAYGFYKGFAAKLADQGYITYAPHNPYRGHDAFRELQRQANPLGLSLFSFIIAQHQVTTDWLAGLPFVDPQRIGFYGLSYGGKTAMRVPALVDRYALSICSGDFNEWIRKCVSVEERNSFMFTGEYEMFEWNLAWNANYAEMAMLIAPRPFMVERGHKDGVAIDELVGYEYAKVLRGYQRLGIPNLTSIEWFDGPHTINGVGTFDFLRQHLGPPKH